MRFFRIWLLVGVCLVSLTLGCQQSKDTGSPTGPQGPTVPVRTGGGKDKQKVEPPPPPPPPP
jgi:hypothetical protein